MTGRSLAPVTNDVIASQRATLDFTDWSAYRGEGVGQRPERVVGGPLDPDAVVVDVELVEEVARLALVEQPAQAQQRPQRRLPAGRQHLPAVVDHLQQFHRFFCYRVPPIDEKDSRDSRDSDDLGRGRDG